MHKQELAKELKKLLRERALFGKPAATLTTWKVGGPVWCVTEVKSIDEIKNIITLLNERDVIHMPLGMGSNLLFSDHGYDGVLISMCGELKNFTVKGNEIIAGGGAAISGILKEAASSGLSGLEWAAGIPATLGGAIAMNAGSLGHNLAECITGLSLLDKNGELLELAPPNLPTAGYRNGGLPEGSIVLGARIGLRKGDDIQRLIKRNLQLKREKFPLDLPSAGSVFQNPPGDYAGRLIEEAGLKGYKCGNAQISYKHANFIVNLGAAKADDILKVMRFAQMKVMQLFGIELVPEVKMVGHVW